MSHIRIIIVNAQVNIFSKYNTKIFLSFFPKLQNLDYNSQKTGADLRQGSRRRQPPARPEGGWTVVVKYADEGGPAPEAFEPGSAEPRALTPSEATLQLRQKVRRRRRIIP